MRGKGWECVRESMETDNMEPKMRVAGIAVREGFPVKYFRCTLVYGGSCERLKIIFLRGFTR
jgi:hypothetical protein